MKWLEGLQSNTVLYEAGDNTLFQIHHNGTLQKAKAIALNSAEIKFVRIKAKSPQVYLSKLVDWIQPPI